LAEKGGFLMKKRYILSISLMTVALTALAVLTQPAVPAKAGPGVMPQRQAEDEISAQQTDYLSIAGGTFVPERTGTDFSYQSGGGTSVTGGSMRFMHAPVILPQGATIDAMRFYWYDNIDGEFMSAALYRNNGDGTRTQLSLINSPSGVEAGDHYGSLYQVFSDETVDNSLYNYEIEVSWSSATTDLKLMRIRILYTHP
jgi:hypothetical protein